MKSTLLQRVSDRLPKMASPEFLSGATYMLTILEDLLDKSEPDTESIEQDIHRAIDILLKEVWRIRTTEYEGNLQGIFTDFRDYVRSRIPGVIQVDVEDHAMEGAFNQMRTLRTRVVFTDRPDIICETRYDLNSFLYRR